MSFESCCRRNGRSGGRLRAGRPGNGFTLVELLVVIGIIGVLISILLPALQNARHKANMVACQSNMRQVGTAMLMAANENKGGLPWPSSLYELATTPYMDTHYVFAGMGPPGGRIDYNTGALLRVIGGGVVARQNVMTCPGDTGEPSLHSGMKTNDRNFSYSFNQNIRTNQFDRSTPPKPVLYRIQRVKAASEKIMVGEEVGPNDALWTIYGPDDLPAARHGPLKALNAVRNSGDRIYMRQGLGNYVFFDGHVESMTPEQILDPNKTRMFDPEAR